MEATGVYWKPVWHVLEEPFTLVLANAMHIRNVPGRKSDMNDATWIADLLAHGLIAAVSCHPRRFRSSATSRARVGNSSMKSPDMCSGFRRRSRTPT